VTPSFASEGEIIFPVPDRNQKKRKSPSDEEASFRSIHPITSIRARKSVEQSAPWACRS
jgi:hypothetical protein